jgi:hypothetical protein
MHLRKNWQRDSGAIIIIGMLARARISFVCFVICFLMLPALVAQKYVPHSIMFSGYAGASQAELLAATGLVPGVAIGQPEIQAAAQKLDNTGLFSDIRFSFNGVELHYALKPGERGVALQSQRILAGGDFRESDLRSRTAYRGLLDHRPAGVGVSHGQALAGGSGPEPAGAGDELLDDACG